MRFRLILATIAIATAASAEPVGFAANIPAADGVFQVKYAANLNIGDSFVNFTNTGEDNGLNLCVSLYTFDPAEELISCCSCTITPNGLQSLSVLKSLISNPLTPAIPTSVVIKALVTQGSNCSAGAPSSQLLARGMLAWGTTLHQNTSTAAATYSVTETAFSKAELSGAEFAHITQTCGFIQSNGSGFGICKGCAAGGLGASSSNQ